MNEHERLIWRHGRNMNVLCTFTLGCISTGKGSPLVWPWKTRKISMSFIYPILVQRCHYIDTNLLIYSEWKPMGWLLYNGNTGQIWKLLFSQNVIGFSFSVQFFHIFDNNKIHLKENNTLKRTWFFLNKLFDNITFSGGSEKLFLPFQVRGNSTFAECLSPSNFGACKYHTITGYTYSCDHGHKKQKENNEK